MIDISTLEVSGFKGAILGMRNPFKNRNKSDSQFSAITGAEIPEIAFIGEKDLELCQKLLRSGKDDDSKFMRMIHVQCDINAPLYWWKEMDTYKVSTVANSESTMHTIHTRPFTLNDFAHDMVLDDYTVPAEWDIERHYTPTEVLCDIIDMLNHTRELYFEALATKDNEKVHQYWYNLIQMLPSSYMQKRTWDADYQTLRRIYFARRKHKLAEWSGENGFCEWIMSLPYAEELITYEEKSKLSNIRDFSVSDYAILDSNSPLYLVDKDHGFDKTAEMARIANLITDMTLGGAPAQEVISVVKHSMVVIDAQKLHLDWRRSEKDKNIRGFELKYRLKP